MNQPPSPVKRALKVISNLENRLRELTSEPIAIVGMGCRLPGGANSPEQLWDLLCEGRDGVIEVPSDRFNLEEYYDADPDVPGKMNAKRAGFIDDIDRFDHQFFGISPREMESLDPQQRLLLEVSYQALENGGFPLADISGRKGGVYVGILTFDYTRLRLKNMNAADAYATTGMALSTAAGRLSYFYDWHGPCMAIDGACSSSLLALHQACTSLRLGECEIALAGGVNAILSPYNSILMTKLRTLAPDGKCKVFDADADGYVRAEGCGMLVLKRLQDAKRDGDRVHAVIKGSVLYQDGRSNGLAAPNGLAQEAMLRLVLDRTKTSPEAFGLIETHGVGTALGDPIEVDAIANVFGQPRADGTQLALGSLKSNLGHLEPAAGVAAVLKTVLALQQGHIPKNLHFRQLNPHIQLTGTCLTIPNEPLPWPVSGEKRTAGVNGFGVNGSLAHVVLTGGSPPALPSDPHDTPLDTHGVLPISAASASGLRAQAESFRDFLRQTTLPLGDILFSATCRRSHFEHGLAVSGQSRAAIADHLDAYLQGETPATLLAGRKHTLETKPIFVFSGQGPTWWPLPPSFLKIPVIHATLRECEKLILRHDNWRLLDALVAPASESNLGQTRYTQPALFAVQVAIAAWWAEQGIEPAYIIGHSMGEVAAAHVAGALSLDDAINVIFHRGRLIQTLCGQGKMAYVERSFEEASRDIQGYEGRLAVAVENGPRASVLSGEADALDDVLQRLEAQDVFCKRLASVDFASHGPLMEAIQPEMRAALKTIQPRDTQVPLFSTTRGHELKGTAFDADYWAENLRATVRFGSTMNQIFSRGRFAVVEIAPHPVLSAAVNQIQAELDLPAACVGSLHRDADPAARLPAALGGLFSLGLPIDWSRLYTGQFVDLPRYPWQKSLFPAVPAFAIRNSQEELGETLTEMVNLALAEQAGQAPLDMRLPAQDDDTDVALNLIADAFAQLGFFENMPSSRSLPADVVQLCYQDLVWNHWLPLLETSGWIVQSADGYQRLRQSEALTEQALTAETLADVLAGRSQPPRFQDPILTYWSRLPRAAARTIFSSLPKDRLPRIRAMVDDDVFEAIRPDIPKGARIAGPACNQHAPNDLVFTDRGGLQDAMGSLATGGFLLAWIIDPKPSSSIGVLAALHWPTAVGSCPSDIITTNVLAPLPTARFGRQLHLFRSEYDLQAGAFATWSGNRVTQTADESAGTTEPSREEILAMPAEQKRKAIQTFLSQAASRELYLPADHLELDQPLRNAGLDSLMALQIKQQIQKVTGVSIPVAVIMRGASLRQLMNVVFEAMTGENSPTKSESPSETQSPSKKSDPAVTQTDHLDDTIRNHPSVAGVRLRTSPQGLDALISWQSMPFQLGFLAWVRLVQNTASHDLRLVALSPDTCILADPPEGLIPDEKAEIHWLFNPDTQLPPLPGTIAAIEPERAQFCFDQASDTRNVVKHALLMLLQSPDARKRAASDHRTRVCFNGSLDIRAGGGQSAVLTCTELGVGEAYVSDVPDWPEGSHLTVTIQLGTAAVSLGAELVHNEAGRGCLRWHHTTDSRVFMIGLVADILQRNTPDLGSLTTDLQQAGWDRDVSWFLDGEEPVALNVKALADPSRWPLESVMRTVLEEEHMDPGQAFSALTGLETRSECITGPGSAFEKTIRLSNQLPLPDESVWFQCASPQPDASLRLFCFPFLGGAASFHRGFTDLIPGIETLGVQLPGRENRLWEQPYQMLLDAVDGLEKAMRPYLDRPFAFFAHSLGSIIAYELTRRLRELGQPAPSALIISAMPPPDYAHANTWITRFHDGNVDQLANNPDGTPLQDPELLSLVLPTMRADLAMIQNYRHTRGKPLNVPLHLFGAHDDPMMGGTDLFAWQTYSKQYRGCRMFTGDHFYLIRDAARETRTALADILATFIEEPAQLPGLAGGVDL